MVRTAKIEAALAYEALTVGKYTEAREHYTAAAAAVAEHAVGTRGMGAAHNHTMMSRLGDLLRAISRHEAAGTRAVSGKPFQILPAK